MYKESRFKLKIIKKKHLSSKLTVKNANSISYDHKNNNYTVNRYQIQTSSRSQHTKI